MAITVNSVTGAEMWESFRKGRADNGPFVTLSYLVPFAQADAFVDGCMGGVVSTGGPDGTLRNLPKLRCPTNQTLYAMRAEYEGVGETNPTSNGRPEFTHAKVAVTFEIPSWPQFASDDPGGQQAFPNEITPDQPYIFAECEIDYGGDLITLQPGSYVWESDGKPVYVPVTKHVGVDTFRIIRHWFPYLPSKLVRSLRNKINNNFPFLGVDRGHVRFAGARTKQVKTSSGTRTQMFELNFEVRERDWNEFIRDDDGKWDTITAKGDSTLNPYLYADLSPLLK